MIYYSSGLWEVSGLLVLQMFLEKKNNLFFWDVGINKFTNGCFIFHFYRSGSTLIIV